LVVPSKKNFNEEYFQYVGSWAQCKPRLIIEPATDQGNRSIIYLPTGGPGTPWECPVQEHGRGTPWSTTCAGIRCTFFSFERWMFLGCEPHWKET
jgi:hypothetical protein